MPRHLLLAALLLTACSTPEQPTPDPEPQAVAQPDLPQRGISAHRGAAATHPENTLAAIEEAVRLGAHQLEIDVHLTSDDALVLLHDETLTRTTDVAQKFPDRESRQIADYTLAEVRTLDAGSWKDASFAGHGVPTLEEAFAVIPADRWVNLDVKGERELGVAVAREVLRLGRERQSVLSLRGEAAEGAASVSADLIVNNMERQSTNTEYVDRTLEGDFDFIQFFRGPFPELADIERLRAAGVHINYCCTDDPDDLAKWFEAGIDFPLVDNPGPALEVAARAGIPPMR